MQSSYSLVKKDKVLKGERKTINTEYTVVNKITAKGNDLTQLDIERNSYISSYENIAKGLVEEAKKASEQIRISAIEEANKMEKEAYEKGYKQGTENGYEDGKNEAINSVLPIAKQEALEMKNEARKLLLSAQDTYNKYLDEKKEEIIRLAIAISEKILKRNVIIDDEINDMIEDILKNAKGEESIIIRCNECNIEKIKEKIEYWKSEFSISKEIFVLKSEKLEPGNAIIEKTTGKIEVGIDIGLESIEKAILG